jgi:hypothetical protein
MQHTTRDIIPFPHVPLQAEKFDQGVQLPSTGHGCGEVQEVMFIGDPAQ